MKKQLMSRAPSRGQHQIEDLDSININMLDSPEVFDFPGLSAQLFEIAQAAHLPSEYMVHIVQIAELGQWKQMQDDNGVLSYRELARRGQAIERSIFGQATLTTAPNYYPPSTPPHALTPQINYAHIPNASTSAQFIGGGAVPQPANFAAVVSQSSPLQLVYLDACIFMLHSVVSGPNPRVPELHGAAQQILSRLQAIPANQRPVSLIFPLCIAGILGDNAETQRVQAQISSLGASPDLAQAVNRLIAHIRQARWAHELNTSNPLMS
ncbi:hypothetical protein FS842_002233 [Serendipita sp. 407]|nr:hypothetical protein FRC16_000172 [Serendipita sp. 398]KAG9055423.1 hypothetical protein FS842_002233 [Serendipita sp. 407]